MHRLFCKFNSISKIYIACQHHMIYREPTKIGITFSLERKKIPVSHRAGDTATLAKNLLNKCCNYF